MMPSHHGILRIVMSKITLEEFRDQFEGSPISVEEMAQTVIQHLDPDDPHSTDAREMVELAEQLVAAQDAFLEFLNNANFELG
jgi:hypothetical protein